MFKSIICSFLLFFVLIIATPSQANAIEPSVDQSCSGDREHYYDVDLHLQIVQVFTPTRNTLDSISLNLKATFDAPVKAKMSLYRVEPNEELLEEKYFSIQGSTSKYYTINFNAVHLSEGVYAFIVRTLHDNEIAYAITTDGDCYPNGFTVISDGIRNDRDMLFTVNTYDSGISNDHSDSTGTNNKTFTSQNLGQSSQTEGSSPKNSSSQNFSQANKTNPYSEKISNDTNYQEEIALIMKDIEEHRYTGGAFGLQGAVGRFLTWPVFIGICAFIFVVLAMAIVIIVLHKKKIYKNKKYANDQRKI